MTKTADVLDAAGCSEAADLLRRAAEKLEEHKNNDGLFIRDLGGDVAGVTNKSLGIIIIDDIFGDPSLTDALCNPTSDAYWALFEVLPHEALHALCIDHPDTQRRVIEILEYIMGVMSDPSAPAPDSPGGLPEGYPGAPVVGPPFIPQGLLAAKLNRDRGSDRESCRLPLPHHRAYGSVPRRFVRLGYFVQGGASPPGQSASS